MRETKVNYDEQADVLALCFLWAQRACTGVELADNILLRLNTGRATGDPPRAVGLTLISFSRLIAFHRNKPLTISLERLRNLPENLWSIVVSVITSPPVSDFLRTELAVAPRVPPLPELVRM